MEKDMACERLSGLREEIDSIDEKIIALFERRMDTARAIGRIKRENNMAIKNQGREDQVKANCRTNCKNSLYLPYAESVMMCIIDGCRGIQDKDAAEYDAHKEK